MERHWGQAVVRQLVEELLRHWGLPVLLVLRIR